jgi:hypothetical protein
MTVSHVWVDRRVRSNDFLKREARFRGGDSFSELVVAGGLCNMCWMKEDPRVRSLTARLARQLLIMQVGQTGQMAWCCIQNTAEIQCRRRLDQHPRPPTILHRRRHYRAESKNKIWNIFPIMQEHELTVGPKANVFTLSKNLSKRQDKVEPRANSITSIFDLPSDGRQVGTDIWRKLSFSAWIACATNGTRERRNFLLCDRFGTMSPIGWPTYHTNTLPTG